MSKVNKIKIKKYLSKGKDNLKNLISPENISKIKSVNPKDVFIKGKEKFKKLIAPENISKIKNFKTKDLFKNGKRKLFKLTSSYQNYAEKFISNLVKEEGSEIWSGLSQSQKWSGRLIWTFVGVTAFNPINALF